MTPGPKHLYLCRTAWRREWGDSTSVHASKRKFYIILHYMHENGLRKVAPVTLEVDEGLHVWTTKLVGPKTDHALLTPVELGTIQPRFTTEKAAA